MSSNGAAPAEGVTPAAAASAPTEAAAASSSKSAAMERDKKRLSIRQANAQVWREGPRPPKGPLDSNMKKNTGFIKRVKQTLGVESRDHIVKEVATLNLDKYVEEVVQAIPEGLAKCASQKDSFAAAESISALHQRFGPTVFSVPLSSLLSAQLSMPSRVALQALSSDQKEKDEAARVARQRPLLRATAELCLVDLIRSKTAEAGDDPPNLSWLFSVTKDLLSVDREHSNVPIVITLLKGFGPTLIGPSSSSSTASVDNNLDEGADVLVPRKVQSRFRKLFETYFSTLEKRITREYERLQEQDRRNHEAYIKSGEIFEDRQHNYERMTKNFEKVHEWGKSLSDLLGVPMPKLKSEAKSSGVGLAINLDSRSSLGADRATEAEFATGKSPWEDDDTRRFYEDLTDLRDLVPPSLLGEKAGAEPADPLQASAAADAVPSTEGKQASAEVSPLMSDSAELGETIVPSDDEAPPAAAAATTKDEIDMGAGPAAQLTTLLTKLPELTNRAMIDSAAVDFAFMNSKGARKRLVKHLGAIPRNRSDLIPYYARLVATLQPYMPDVGQGIVALLDQEFRYLQKKKNVDLSETRAKNVRFLGELTKFKVTPLYTIFHCFKMCLDDFAGPNIENLATLLETCGRYLLRNEETGERTRNILEMVRRKRAAQNLDHRYVLMLDNAYYQCNPPDRTAVPQKERSSIELYIRWLIYEVLAKKTAAKVLLQLRKLPWGDASVRKMLEETFVRSWRVRFSNLHLLAVLVADLQAYHPDFAIHVIDTVCEQMHVGMETNIFKHNVRRVATTKYLGELYNYRLVGSSLILDQLWAFVTFGHPGGRPLPGQVCPIDAPDDYFRIRLVCTLLDACGHCFDRGLLRKRLDDFLIFLNLYLLSKTQPVPMDVDFMLADTLETLRPKFVMSKSFDQVSVQVDAMLAAAAASNEQQKQKESLPSVMDQDDGEEDEESSASEEELVDARSKRRESASDTESEDETVDDDDDDEGDGEGDEDEDDEGGDESGSSPGQVAGEFERNHDQSFDQDAEDEFARELAKMMTESSSSASALSANRGHHHPKGIFDAGIPFIKKQQQERGVAGAKEMESSNDQHMRFTLLSKRGNKHLAHDVQVPADSAIAVNSRANERQQLAERQQLKKLVLGYEGRDDQDRAAMDASLARRTFRSNK